MKNKNENLKVFDFIYFFFATNLCYIFHILTAGIIRDVYKLFLEKKRRKQKDNHTAGETIHVMSVEIFLHCAPIENESFKNYLQTT